MAAWPSLNLQQAPRAQESTAGNIAPTTSSALSVLEEALQSHKQCERSLEDFVEGKAVFNF